MLREGKKDSPLESLEGVQPCQLLDSRLQVPRCVKKYISVVVSHLVCGNLYGSRRKIRYHSSPSEAKSHLFKDKDKTD